MANARLALTNLLDCHGAISTNGGKINIEHGEFDSNQYTQHINIKQLIMSRTTIPRYRVPFLSVHSHSTNRSKITQSCRIQVDLSKGIAGLKV